MRSSVDSAFAVHWLPPQVGEADAPIAEGSQTLELIRELDIQPEDPQPETDEEDGETQSKA